MLNISFLTLIATSTAWIFFCIKNLPFNTYAPAEVYQFIHIMFIPLFAVWCIYAIIKNIYQSLQNNRKAIFFLEQIKKNSDSIDAINSTITNYTKELRDNIILQQSDNLISDINETLSEIIKRSNSISTSQMEYLWQRASDGKRWLIAKTFIETNNFQTGFIEHIQEKANKDPLLKGSILEFYAKYKNLTSLLENHDTYKILSSTVENGALGKVFNILSPIALSLSEQNNKQQTTKTTKETKNPNVSEATEIPSFLTAESEARQTKQQSSNQNMVEEGLKAIREELTKPTPKTNITTFASTQSALRNLKPEIKKSNIISIDELEREINASPDNNYDTSISPLGDWLDEKKN